MFCFTPAAILAAFARHAPDVLDAARAVVATRWRDSATRRCSRSMPALFAAVPDISIDYAVMEKAAADGEVAVVRGDVRLERRRLVAGGGAI